MESDDELHAPVAVALDAEGHYRIAAMYEKAEEDEQVALSSSARTSGRRCIEHSHTTPPSYPNVQYACGLICRFYAHCSGMSEVAQHESSACVEATDY